MYLYLMEGLPKEAINLIFRFSPHPLAELIKPCIQIDNGDRRISVKLGRNRYYQPKQYYNQMEEDFIQARVLGNRIRTYTNKHVFNLTDIPIHFDDGFLFEHCYSIANFGLFGISKNDGRMF